MRAGLWWIDDWHARRSVRCQQTPLLHLLAMTQLSGLGSDPVCPWIWCW
jgi:hypothetical protein